ncbi:MAG: hypothetical protein J5903_03700 [Clostridia bacterium]|nr:hypothetical protein [Clostridia bacterium]
MKKSNIEIGISTASLFMREYGEDAVVTLQALDSRITEMFFETFPEYEEEFARLVRSRSGDLGFHSVHVYTMHYEPELFSLNERSYGVAEATFRKVLTNAKILGAGNYTMHGRARMKKSGFYDDYAFIGKRLDKLCGIAREYSVALCLENVEWAFYNRV